MKTYFGVDVSKSCLDVCHLNKSFAYKNSDIEIQKFIKYIKKQKYSEKLVVFEPSGGYEKRLQYRLQSRKIGYCKIHANRVKAFCEARGIKAKTDEIDAKLIADYAETMNLEADRIKEHQDLKEYVKRREQLVTARAKEKTRLSKEYEEDLKESLKRSILFFSDEISLIEKKITQIIKKSACMKKIKLLTSVPGIGKTVAYYILCYMPEITELNQKQLMSLAGLAPFNRDSGSYRGKRYIKGGRPELRRMLYMAAMRGINCNKDLNRIYKNLTAKGKPGKVALVVIMRKILLMSASVLKRSTPWEERAPKLCYIK